MPAKETTVELPLLEILAAAPESALDESYLELAALAVYAAGAMKSVSELNVTCENGVARCDDLIHALFSGFDRGLIDRHGSAWRLTERGTWALRKAHIAPSDEARRIVASVLEMRLPEALTEVSATLSSQYAMMASANGQPLRL